MLLKKLPVLFFATLLLILFCSPVNSQWVASGTVPLVGNWPSISVANPNVIWIAGGQATPQIFRSVNGGTTWTAIGTTGLPAKALMCVWAIDSLIAFVGDGGDAQGQTGGDARVSMTTNGGQTWTSLFNTGGTAGFFNGIVFSRTMPSFGFAESDPQTGAGQPYYVQKSTNGGMNWTLTSPPGISGAASAQNSLVCIDDQFYGYGLNAGASRVYFTSNGGTSWTIGTLGIAGSFVSGFAFHTNKQYGIASTSTSFPTIARTTNGGTTWSSVSLGTGTATISSMKWIENSNTCYFVAPGTTTLNMYKSTNSGANWTAMTTPVGLLGFSHFDFCLSGSTVTGFAIAPGGLIIKLTETVTLIPGEETTVPTEFSLRQNYPNPFNPVTKISYALPKSSNVILKVFDMLGKEVSVIENGFKNAGNYTVEFDASKLTSGMYFYKIEAGDFKDTKKMMLLK